MTSYQTSIKNGFQKSYPGEGILSMTQLSTVVDSGNHCDISVSRNESGDVVMDFSSRGYNLAPTRLANSMHLSLFLSVTFS